MPRSLPKSTPALREQEDTENTRSAQTAPPSPSAYRRSQSYLSETHTEYQSLDAPLEISETTSLLGPAQDFRRRGPRRSYTSTSGVSGTGPESLRHLLAAGSLRRTRNHSRANSTGRRFSRQGSIDGDSRPASLPPSTKDNLTASSFLDERTWYDQFTSTDWVHDSIADGARLRLLRQRKDVRGRLLAAFDGAQGWILVALIGCITASIAYFVDVTEGSIFDLKEGFCTTQFFRNRRTCCKGVAGCDAWRPWSMIFSPSGTETQWVDFVMFVFWVVTLALISCALTLLTKTVVPSSISLATLDENLGADSRGTKSGNGLGASGSPLSETENSPVHGTLPNLPSRPAMIYYSAAGSGVAEVKVINSGFVLHGYMGLKTLVIKTIGLIFSVSSGLSLGKEGPYVHIATCVGNICCRLFAKYNQNDGKRREVLSASAASGVAVAFGAPIGGVLFSLEEVSYYFPPKTLFRTFFCCIAATLSLKFLNPYGTGKIVLFEVRYLSDWQIFEIFIFILLGIMGGAAGALFIKASNLWARSFRRIPAIKRWPMLEVFLVALVTGIISFWNRYTKLPVTELLFELASPCESDVESTGLCPRTDGILEIVQYLLVAFVIKSFLTIITFGIKVPAGIYVPSMVVGGLMGRIVGHLIQYWALRHPTFFLFDSCPAVSGIESCVTPGVYALIAAGATMCGVTRLSVTLPVILFELTGSLNHVLPFSLSVLCAKWTADAIEPRSIYDLLTDMNAYPFLDSKLQPTTDAELGDIVRPVRKNRIIDISGSPFVSATNLRLKLEHLLMAGELDSGLPILRDGVLAGLIPAPDLEYALDTLGDEEENTICLMAMDTSAAVYDSENEDAEQVDFSRYIDPAPIALDIHSPIDLVYQCFAKLGLRYLCVTQDGKYAGLVHKKAFVKFMKENSD
ncbi:Cystathionine beta-synthase, core [Penicillium expansum]|uniref:Chloride channel protein n=1 Tax=Penicillium expansum TaxID=27334 RepID=A0A0A2J5T4_PENEN|nr:Cystathionine beta-synthase, core [Penicillium expansum]KGO39692.1 Cystathionine beta-synthase, core [Penicillium expansum]KGO50669.1 Cystathionine beta-synthase, core [Penicillium expansum]KGO62691.1 Cystathionine beta-synthase, core [Penicillium expansum]